MFRFDRFLTLHFFHPIAKRRRPQEGLKVPILMYHGIGELQKKGSHFYYETATSPEVFAAHMAFLKEDGYRAVGLNGLAGLFSNPERSIEKCVVITFDDGLADFRAAALPVLNRHGFSVTVFLPAGLMGQEVNGQACMTWDEVRESAAKGITFGSHSLTHPKMVDLTPPERRATLMAAHNVLAALAVFIGASIGGFLGMHLPNEITVFGRSFHWLSALYGVFLISGLMRLTVVATFLPRIEEVRPVRRMSMTGLIFRVTRFAPVSGLIFEIVGTLKRRRNDED